MLFDIYPFFAYIENSLEDVALVAKLYKCGFIHRKFTYLQSVMLGHVGYIFSKKSLKLHALRAVPK